MFDGCLTLTLTMAFNTLKYPSHKLGSVSPFRSRKTRSNRIQAVPLSPFLMHADENGKVFEFSTSRNSLVGLGNTVGVIGGVSVDSTLKFLRKLVQYGSREEPGNHNIPLVLCSDPELSKNLLLHERSCLPSLASGRTEHTPSDPTPIVANLRSKRVFLEKSGAKCIVMPCHVSHSWHGEVFEGNNVDVLHMGECVARQLKEAKLKPIEAGSPLRIGVLGTIATLNAGFYQESLQNQGFEVVLPDKATMEHTVIPAINAIARKDMEGARNLLRIALQFLLMRAVNSIILASDDLRELLPQDDPLLKKCIDPVDALARSTVKWAQSAEKHTQFASKSRSELE